MARLSRVPRDDPIGGLGSEPITLSIIDATENHKRRTDSKTDEADQPLKVLKGN